MNGGIGLGLKLGFGGGAGELLGPELFTNPSFDTTMAGWTDSTTPNYVSSGGNAVVGDVTTSGTLFQNVATTTKNYRITVLINSLDGGVQLRIGGTIGPNILTAGMHTMDAVATTALCGLVTSLSNDIGVSLDYMSVKEIL